jgi:flagellar M-ring protein FliF
MAETNIQTRTPNALDTLQGVSEKPVFRQLALMVGIAASVALGAAVILWSQSPDYTVLYSDVPESQLGEISDALKQQNIDYKLDPVSGKVMVPASQLDKARINLASMGLHKVSPKGFDILNQEQGFGTSQFIQNARYHKALEDELALSITSMRSIKNARVHLAIPKQSVFIRDRKKPTASVILDMFSGRSLTKNQIAAISNMVSSSIEDMNAIDVTIVDQMGRLLTENTDSNMEGINDKQMMYTQKLEGIYNDKVSKILTPFLGSNGFSVQVKTDMDFDRKEVTSEQYNPDLSATRSKQQLVEKSSNINNSGIPGALSNQPPGGSVVPEKVNKDGTEGGSGKSPFRSRETLTENYEVDKSISHIAYSTGKIKQLSVAVVVDDKKVTDKDGKVSSIPRTSDEIQRITSLIKEAVGYNIQRGDTVNVINAAFVQPVPLEALPEIPVWEQSWFMSVIKQALAGLVVLYLLFGVIRPAFKNLSRPAGQLAGIEGETEIIGSDGKPVSVDKDGKPIGLSNEPQVDADGNVLPSPDEMYQMELELARKLVVDDPKVAAQVIKNWIK